MWRALVFIGLLCVAAFGAVWLADRPGTVLITFGGYEIQTSMAVAAIALAGSPWLWPCSGPWSRACSSFPPA